MRPLHSIVFASLALVACGGGGGTTTTGTGATLTGGTTPGTGTPATGMAHTGDTSTTSTVDKIEFDCSTVGLPKGIRHVPGAKGYHDVDFDSEGNILGANGAWNSDLVKADSSGAQTIWLPNVGTVQQMVWLPTGELAVASQSYGIVLITAQGGTSVLNPNIRPYGLILGPDEMLYSADEDQVHRIDPTTGQAEVLVARNVLPSGSPRVLNFNLDFTKLLIGTLFGNGRIYEVPLDATYTPTGPPSTYASNVGTGSYHDTLGVDVCGFIYVADYSTSSFNRISPSGVVVELFSHPTEYPHGMEWGTGEDGWLDDAVYLSQPYNQYNVIEVDIGVPSRDNPNYTPINLP